VDLKKGITFAVLFGQIFLAIMRSASFFDRNEQQKCSIRKGNAERE
jgi:hypothetical protein